MRLIDADALREVWLENGENEYIYDTNIFLNSIDDVPTVDAVPVVHATWLYDDEDDRKNVECSHCHMKWAVSSDDPDSDYLVLHMVDNELIFCPSCGARMDEKEATK